MKEAAEAAGRSFMRYPDFLTENGKIGFLAPSFGCSTEPYKSAFDSAQETFRALGHGIVCGPNVYKGDGCGISTSPEACGAEFMASWLSEESDVLLSCGGGELMCEILDSIDFEAVRAAKPKWFMGYSDNTNLTFLLTTLCGTASVYGPCAPAFGMKPWHPALQDAYDVLRGRKTVMEGYPLFELISKKDEEHPLEPYNVTAPRVIRAYDGQGKPCEKVSVQGRLVGGCLDVLANLAGTKFDRVREFSDRCKGEGVLWFLESCDLTVFGMRRALWELAHAGWFDNASGFLIGRPYLMGQTMMGLDAYEAVLSPLREFGVPVLMDLDIGHLPPMMPVISGSYGRAELDGQALRLSMELS